jgi:hypothetical protein
MEEILKDFTNEQIIEHFEKSKMYSVFNHILKNQLDHKKYRINHNDIYFSYEEFGFSLFFSNSGICITLLIKEGGIETSIEKRYHRLGKTISTYIAANDTIYKYFVDKINTGEAFKIKKQNEDALLKKLDNFEGTL